MNPGNLFSDSEFLDMKWIYDFAQTWMRDRARATAFALDVLMKEKNERIMRLPKEVIDMNIMSVNGMITVATVLTALGEKFRMFLAMKDKIGPNDYKVLQNIYKEISSFATDLKAVTKESGLDKDNLLEDPPEEEGMSKIEIQKYIDSILDAYSAGRLTSEQMKNQLKEFASRPSTDIGRFGANILGTLGLNT